MDNELIIFLVRAAMVLAGFLVTLVAHVKTSRQRRDFDAKVIADNSTVIRDNTRVLRELIPYLERNPRG